MTIASVTLAAGYGKRMYSQKHKVLHEVAGKPLIWYALRALEGLTDLAPVVVVGQSADEVKDAVKAAIPWPVQFALQGEQLGTGHAVQCAQSLLEGKAALVLVTFGDMPLLSAKTLRAVLAHQQQTQAVLTMTSVLGDVPRGFGRVVRDETGRVKGIVEEADASPQQLKIREYNISAYCFDAEWLWHNLGQIKKSPKGEYYLTDMVEIAVSQGRRVESLIWEDPVEGLGVNNRLDLADCEMAMRRRINTRHLLAGVSMDDPASILIEPEVEIGSDSSVLQGSRLCGKTRIGSNSVIGPSTYLYDSQVGDGCKIISSVCEYARIGNQVSMGPFCHLRPNAVLKDGVHMGNFGEVKDSTLEEGVKMGHFSYIGNAKIGANVNIGAGTITCNFDGQHKNPTEIGENTFIGSDTMLVAPLKIGKNAITGAGSVVTHDVADGELVVGVPAKPRAKKQAPCPAE
ncbi:MAG: bifunctional UDP-N-acetylglucosamine diphosphorylase/glucosamine-1-phosphate N-acetyltransferase GlmU [Anaerolineaceae bacterium]|nr:bifunctional UDP-N-acetylglucosamine diphosphorylase/glucosamine-1-phosphate N-acetyltransferase GlmU [Anaerolineaceae bacterium]